MNKLKKIFLFVSMFSILGMHPVFADDTLNSNIYNHLKNWDTEFSINYYCPDVLSVITNTFSSDGYLERSISEIKYSRLDHNVTVEITYRTSKEQEDYINSQLTPIVADINTKYTTDYDKVRAVNNFIMQRYDYDYSFSSNNAYTALLTGKTTCQGYALTVCKMLDMLNIDNRLVVGKLNDVPHGWNMVKIDNNWYQLDVTNNDVQHNKFFLVNDTTLLNKGFSWDASKYPICISNYLTK